MYGSADSFVEYHESRGRIIPGTWDTDYIESALLVASEYIDNRYGSMFTGYKTGGFNQEREWPRSAAYANIYPIYNFTDQEIPDRLVNAVYEAAWREGNEQGSLLVDFIPSKYQSVSISDALYVKYKDNQSVHDIQKQIQIIEQLLAPLFHPSNSMSNLSGDISRV